MRNGNLLKSCVSEICVKQIRVNQGVGVIGISKFYEQIKILIEHCAISSCHGHSPDVSHLIL